MSQVTVHAGWLAGVREPEGEGLGDGTIVCIDGIGEGSGVVDGKVHGIGEGLGLGQ